MTSQVVSVEREDESDYDYLEGDWWRSNDLTKGLLLYLFIVEFYRFSTCFGIEIDSQFNFKKHINSIQNKTSKGVGILYKLSKFTKIVSSNRAYIINIVQFSNTTNTTTLNLLYHCVGFNV